MANVTIGVPVFNGANYLAEALESVLAQTYSHFHLVISDNASTDATEEICRDYAARDERITYHRLPKNLGAGPNYDRVFHLSDTPYFQWLAHDDLIYPNFLEHTVAALEADPEAVLAFTRCADIDPVGEIIEIEPARPELASPQPHIRLASAIFSGHNTYPIFGLMRTRVLATTSLHGSFTGSDRVMLAEMAMAGPFVEVDETLFGYRRHPEQSVRLNTGKSRAIFAQPREAWFDVTKAGKITFPNWRRLGAYVRAVRKSSAGVRDKRLAHREIVKWFFDRNWKKLVLDLATAVVLMVRKVIPRR